MKKFLHYFKYFLYFLLSIIVGYVLALKFTDQFWVLPLQMKWLSSIASAMGYDTTGFCNVFGCNPNILGWALIIISTVISMALTIYFFIWLEKRYRRKNNADNHSNTQNTRPL